jgi:histidinol-phosphate aminotransferase
MAQQPPIPVRAAVSRIRRYVPGKPVGEVQRELGLHNIIKLASNENPLGPSPKAIAAIRDAASSVHVYPESTAPELAIALEQRLGVEHGHVFVGNGSDEILRLLCAAYLNPNDRVVVPGTSFPTYANAANGVDAQVSTIPLKDFSMDLESMAAAVVGHQHEAKAKIVFLCRPNNPTGTVFDEASFRKFLAHIGNDVLVVVDEAYHEFDTSGFSALSLLSEFRNILVTRTFSKIYGLGGLRIGFGVADPAIWNPLYSMREPFTINYVAQKAALAALEDHEHVEQTISLTAQGRERVYKLCDELGITYIPSYGNFVLVDVARPAQPVYEELLKMGIIVRPGFGLEHHIRVSIGTQAEMDRFEEGFRQVMKAQ